MAILSRDGVGGFFKGFLPNVIKNAPNKSIQLTTFDMFKRKIKESDAAYEEEKAILAKEASKGGKKK